jgi:Holliday junction resolvasome RuvABC endonuclease subunit
MITLGIDPASQRSGFCVLEDGKKILTIEYWDSNKKLTLPERLKEFREQVSSYFPVDAVAVEELAVNRNFRTVKALSRFEAIALLVPAEWGVPVHHIKPNKARQKAFKKAIPKELVYQKVSKKAKLAPFDKGGNDQSDAWTLAKAAYILETTK